MWLELLSCKHCSTGRFPGPSQSHAGPSGKFPESPAPQGLRKPVVLCKIVEMIIFIIKPTLIVSLNIFKIIRLLVDF